MKGRFSPVTAAVLLAIHAAGAAQEHHHAAAGGVEKPVVFLDKSPRIVAFQLARLSDAQLLLVDREPTHPKFIPVYEAILLRPALPAPRREEAISALARIRKSDAATEILAVIRQLPAEKADLAPGLTRLLLSQPAADLKRQEPSLRELFSGDNPVGVRRAACAALAATQPADATWSLAERSQGVEHLISVLPLVPQAAARAAYFPRLLPLLQPGAPAGPRRAAIAAAAHMPGHEAATIAALSVLIARGAEAAHCARALSRIPRERWPDVDVPRLCNALLDQARSIPAPRRTEDDYLDIAQLGTELAARLPREKGAPLRRAFVSLGVNVLRLRSLHEQMYFDKTLLLAEAGKPVELVFENTDAMPHNWVLVALGAADAIATAAEAMAAQPDALGRVHVPASPQVLQATRMLNAGERVRLPFTAPKEPGDYPFLCTFPGHGQRMRGTLKVVADLESYLVQHPQGTSEVKITEWTLADFAADLARTPPAGNRARGKEVFAKAACASCHQLGGEGVAFGPSIGEALRRHQGNAGALLTEILDPSKFIDEKFRNYNFELSDDESLSGIILKEDAASVTVRSGPGEAQVKVVPKNQIKSRRASVLSVMPAGLLNTMSREDVLDLLAHLMTADASPAPK